MRIDGDTLLLLVFLGLIFVVSLALPFLGNVSFGLTSAAIAGVLEVGLVLDIRRARRGGDGGPNDGGRGDDPPSRGGGGGAGVREPRRPRRTPPSTTVRR